MSIYIVNRGCSQPNLRINLTKHLWQAYQNTYVDHCQSYPIPETTDFIGRRNKRRNPDPIDFANTVREDGLTNLMIFVTVLHHWLGLDICRSTFVFVGMV